jgi:ABC-type sugar transport system ATPase subunit
MAMVFQNYALYPNMTVFENIGFSLKLRRRPASEITERVTQVAEMLDIGHLLHRKPGQLSGGQQQRVALGRALVKQPLVFLLDEPFSNLDASLRARMRTEVKHLHLALGTTSVFVTHDQEEAMTLSDLICVMREGKIVQSGSQTEIYGKPRSLYVAEFVGKPKMSLLDGSLEHGADGVTFVSADVRIDLGPAARLGLTDGAWPTVALGVRAEDVIVHPNGSAAGRATFGATVGLMEPIGSDTFVELDVGTATVVARVDPDLPIALGQRVSAELRPSGIHLFARESGERIVA